MNFFNIHEIAEIRCFHYLLWVKKLPNNFDWFIDYYLLFRRVANISCNSGWWQLKSPFLSLNSQGQINQNVLVLLHSLHVLSKICHMSVQPLMDKSVIFGMQHIMVQWYCNIYLVWSLECSMYIRRCGKIVNETTKVIIRPPTMRRPDTVQM